MSKENDIWATAGEHPDTRRAPDRLESVDLYVNASCNLRCSTCFLGDEYFDGREMSLESAISIVRWAAGRGVTDLVILGGEPTLWAPLPLLIRASRDLGIETVRLVTNAARSFRRFLTAFTERLDLVVVSLDGGQQETHDLIRGRGSFTNVLRSIDLLASTGQRFAITMTAHRHAIAEVPVLIELAQRLGAEGLVIHWLSSMGRATVGDLDVGPDDWVSVRETVDAAHLWREGFSVDIQEAFVRETLLGGPFAAQPDLSIAGVDCAVRRGTNLQFMPDGRVHQCGLTVDRSDLASYTWCEDRLRIRGGVTEASLAAMNPHAACPVRTSLRREPPLDPGSAWTHACIYRRHTRTLAPRRTLRHAATA